jgi:hypothetical protein
MKQPLTFKWYIPVTEKVAASCEEAISFIAGKGIKIEQKTSKSIK